MGRRFSFNYDAAGSLIRLFGLGERSSWISISPHELHVHMGWAFDVTIPRGAIIRAERVQSPQGFGSMLIGWGVHTNFNGTWYVNGSQTNLVRVDLLQSVRGRSIFIPVGISTLYLSPDDPDEFVAALR